MLENFEEDYNNTRKFKKKCKAVKKDCKPQTSAITKNDNGDLQTDPTKIAEHFCNHFDELLSNNSTNGSSKI